MGNLNLILGNLFSIFAMLSDSFSSSRKTAKGVLKVQILSQFFYGFGVLVLKGYSGAVQNGVSILRNIAAICKLEHRLIEWGLIALGVGLGILFNNLGLIGWLPILANLEYSLAVFRYKDHQRALKIAFLINLALFMIFNAAILNIIGAIGNVVVFNLTAAFLIRDRKK